MTITKLKPHFVGMDKPHRKGLASLSRAITEALENQARRRSGCARFKRFGRARKRSAVNRSGVILFTMAFILVTGLSIAATWLPDAFSFVGLIPFGDKIAHFILYGLLGASVTHLIAGMGSRWMMVALTLATLYVVIDECVQMHSIHRTFSLADLVVSLAGLWIAGLCVSARMDFVVVRFKLRVCPQSGE